MVASKILLQNQFYSNSYLDTPGVKKIVQFNQSKNGRIVMSIIGMKVFILIECWG
jgi:hypothetical protein